MSRKNPKSNHSFRTRGRLLPALVALLMVAASVVVAQTPGKDAPRRRVSPVNTNATQTQPINETKDDTSRINAARRAASTAIEDDNGQIVFIDTITGERWIDSTALRRVPKMQYPLYNGLAAGLNIWDPIMRIFGQKYGIADAFVEANLHNRYFPVFEVGLGQANYKPDGDNYTYRSPMSVYFRIGANYNFLYNSNPDYKIFAGLRYGFSPFSYSVDDVTLDNPYWDESVTFNVPSQHATAGWLEVCFGVRVKIWGPISAGWTFKYRSLLHESRATYGKPWYIPGYGSRTAPISGAFSITYTIPGPKVNKPVAEEVISSEDNLPEKPAAPSEAADSTEQAPLQ